MTTLEPAIDLKIGELRKAETKKLSDYQKAWGDYQRDKALLTPTGTSGMTMEQGAAAMQAEREALNGLKKAYWKALATADKAYGDTVDAAGAALTKTTEEQWATYLKARVDADVESANRTQLASAAYTIATNNASLTLELALRGAAKDQDDAAAADGKATSSAARTARKTWERALSGGALQLAQKGITSGSQREADQANAMEAFSNSLSTTFNTTFGTGNTGGGGSGTSTAGSGWGALATLATASGTWLSTMLGLVQGRGEKEQDAAEKRDTRKADAQESLVSGIVSGIVGWLNENATARTVFANASVTISTAYDITVRTAGGAYSKRKIDDARDAAIANSERIKTENATRAQAAIDAIEAKSLNDDWNEPSDTMLLQMQYHASDLDADMATQKQSYLDQNGIPALKAWVAEVDASGVLDEEEGSPDSSGGNPTGAQGGGGVDGESEKEDWEVWLEQAGAWLQPPVNTEAQIGNPGTTATQAAPGGSTTGNTSPPGNPASGQTAPASTSFDPNAPSTQQSPLSTRLWEMFRGGYVDMLSHVRSTRGVISSYWDKLDAANPTVDPLSPASNSFVDKYKTAMGNVGIMLLNGSNAAGGELAKSPSYLVDSALNVVELYLDANVNLLDGDTQALREKMTAIRASAAATGLAPLAMAGNLAISSYNSARPPGWSVLRADFYAPLDETRRGAVILDKAGAQVGADGIAMLELLGSGGPLLATAGRSGPAVTKLKTAIHEFRKALAPGRSAALRVVEGSQTAPAVFVRNVRRGETVADLVAEGKAATWMNESEYAVLSVYNESGIERVIVSGGRDGIDFIEQNGKLFFEMEGRRVQVRRVLGHTHPRATGPSGGDQLVLEILDQEHSFIFEIGGEPNGTQYRRK